MRYAVPELVGAPDAIRSVEGREFITLLGGVSAAWPFATHAQESHQVRLVGVLHYHYVHVDDPVMMADVTSFKEALRRLGWSEGRNM
jgi:hypothetical protein